MSDAPKCECCDEPLSRAAGPGEWVCSNRSCVVEGVVVYVPATRPVNGS